MIHVSWFPAPYGQPPSHCRTSQRGFTNRRTCKRIRSLTEPGDPRHHSGYTHVHKKRQMIYFTHSIHLQRTYCIASNHVPFSKLFLLTSCLLSRHHLTYVRIPLQYFQPRFISPLQIPKTKRKIVENAKTIQTSNLPNVSSKVTPRCISRLIRRTNKKKKTIHNCRNRAQSAL